jgi:hypothetical protein
LHTLLGGVVPSLVSFGSGQDAQKDRIAVRDPGTECKPANENGDAGEDAIEEIESTYRSDADEEEERALNTEICERLV